MNSGWSSGGAATTPITNGRPSIAWTAIDAAKPCQIVNFRFCLTFRLPPQDPADETGHGAKAPSSREASRLHSDPVEIQPLEHIGDIDELLERQVAVGAD